MSWYQASRSIAAAALVAATALLSACGGGGSGPGSAASSAASNQLKLSTAVQSEPVARYAAAFGILSGPGVAAIYTSVVQSLREQREREHSHGDDGVSCQRLDRGRHAKCRYVRVARR